MGKKVLAGLLLVSLRRGFGVSVQAQAPGGVVTSYGKKLLAGDRFDTVYGDSYGLVVFEELGRTGFAKAGEINVRLTGPSTSFLEAWSAAVTATSQIDDRVLIAHDLWAGSRFANSVRARYLLLIMAIEALVEQPWRSDRELGLIDSLLRKVAEAGLEPDQTAALSGGVAMLNRVSIGRSCKLFLDRLIAASVITDREASAYFTESYRIRGKLVHAGLTPPIREMTDRAARLEQTLREALIGIIEGRAA